MPACRLGLWRRRCATLPDWRLPLSGPRALAQALPAMPATDFYTCRLTSLSLRTAGRSTPIGIRLLAIRRSLVPGRPFCPAAASRHARFGCDRPDQSSTRRCRRFPCFARLVLLCRWATPVCLGKRSRLCRRATDEEYPGRRRTKGARRRGQPPPAPSSASPPSHPPPGRACRADFMPRASSLCGW